MYMYMLLCVCAILQEYDKAVEESEDKVKLATQVHDLVRTPNTCSYTCTCTCTCACTVVTYNVVMRCESIRTCAACSSVFVKSTCTCTCTCVAAGAAHA